MNRGDAYTLLARKLHELREVGYEDLLTRVGRLTASNTVQLNGEPVTVDVDVQWADRARGTIRVRATALGPSTWMMERLDESFVIGPNSMAKPINHGDCNAR